LKLSGVAGVMEGRRDSEEEVQGFEVSEREKQAVHTSIRRSVVSIK
jgi:hypothetical protein